MPHDGIQSTRSTSCSAGLSGSNRNRTNSDTGKVTADVAMATILIVSRFEPSSDSFIR